MIRLWEILVRAWPIVLLVIVALIVFVFMPAQWRSNKAAKTAAEVASGQSSATISSAEEAGNTMSNVAANATATDARVAAGNAEIAAAPPGQRGKVARKVACQHKATANRPECKGLNQ
jgi:hypothetical protein